MKKLLALTFALVLILTLSFTLAACSSDTHRTVTIVSMHGTVTLERNDRDFDARGGMRLSNLDTVRTAAASEAELKLDNDKTAWLEEFTALRVDKQSSGFALTLLEGYLTIKIKEQLKTGEDFTVYAGNVALGVRGTVFMVDYNPVTGIVDVYVESGSVVVKNSKTDEVLATLSAGDSEKFDAGTVDYGAAPSGNSGGGDDSGTQQTQDNSGGGDTTTSGDGTGLDNGASSDEQRSSDATDLPDGLHHYEYSVYAYEGYWKSGLPNGHGILTWQAKPIIDGAEMPFVTFMYEGEFVDGLMHGTVTYSNEIEWKCSCFPDGKEVYIFEVNMGYSTVDSIITEGFRCYHTMRFDILVLGVPPWGMYPIDN